tara:strand:+ start:94 stop:702 length:609 start_codon:yes stop_codon:yes gene_type:complete
MSTFQQYLTESAKSYDYKIKVAGDIDKNFASKMETALAKFEIAKMSAGKKTPIQSLPLDFPALSNEAVTIFDVTTNYPASVREMKEYLADYMNVSPALIVVRKPNEPSEEYQEQMTVAKTSEYKNKLQDIEYKDAPKVNAEDFHSTQANMSLLKELLKDREVNKDQPKEKENAQSKEEQGSPSPIKAAHKGPVKGNPNPKGK